MVQRKLPEMDYQADHEELSTEIAAASDLYEAGERDDRIDYLMNKFIAAHIPDEAEVVRHGSGGKGRLEVRTKRQIPW